MVFLIWLAVLPTIMLARRVLALDKIEKEPFGLLAKLFVFGMLTCIPAALIESLCTGVLESLVESAAVISALTYLIVVPLAEEGWKYLALRTTRKHPALNYTFDGIVYGVMVGLGFATLENILYVVEGQSVTLAVMRGVLSVPLHCTCGVYMGYFYGIAKNLQVKGLANQARSARLRALVVPWVIHGLYDYSLDVDSWLVLIAGLVATVITFFLTSRRVKYASDHDEPIMVYQKQPLLDSLFERVLPSKGLPVPPEGK